MRILRKIAAVLLFYLTVLGNYFFGRLLNRLSLTQLSALLDKITHFQDKISFVSKYSLDTNDAHFCLSNSKNWSGVSDILAKYRIRLSSVLSSSRGIKPAIEGNVSGRFDKIQYGCGENLLTGWLNVDCFSGKLSNYCQINIAEKHPFDNESFRFAFAEDVLEHLNQADSLIFLAETHRTLKPGGVVRLSFPGLEGVLSRHYSNKTELFAYTGKVEAYLLWDHTHFYSCEELALVAKHVGFSKIEFCSYGKSGYSELCGLDTRQGQIGLNTYAGLTK